MEITGDFAKDIERAIKLDDMERDFQIRLNKTIGILPLDFKSLKYDIDHDTLELKFPRNLYSDELIVLTEHFRDFVKSYTDISLDIENKYGVLGPFFIGKDYNFDFRLDTLSWDFFPKCGKLTISPKTFFDVRDPTVVESYSMFLSDDCKIKPFLIKAKETINTRKKRLEEELNHNELPEGINFNEIAQFEDKYKILDVCYRIPMSKPVLDDSSKRLALHMGKFLLDNLDESERMKYKDTARIAVEKDLCVSYYNIESDGYRREDGSHKLTGLKVSTNKRFPERLIQYIEFLKK